ncbi:MAG: sufC [Anaerocolumna sp.]|nr:sufC [Anaerocolumna sp.]
MGNELLKIKKIHAKTEDKEILKGLDLTVKKGEIHVIMGPNGAGKSTLGNIIMGHPKYEVTSGTISFEGEDITDAKTDERARATRYLNVGFSGGEKKKNEIIQMMMLNPKLAILDETDSGLDVDAVRIVSNGVKEFKNEDNSVIIITHNSKILEFLKPDFVHILMSGKIIKTGDASLVNEIIEHGFGDYKEERD